MKTKSKADSCMIMLIGFIIYHTITLAFQAWVLWPAYNQLIVEKLLLTDIKMTYSTAIWLSLAIRTIFTDYTYTATES